MLLVAPAPGALAADPADGTHLASVAGWTVDYDYPGTKVTSPAGAFTATIELRAQLRYTSEDFPDAPGDASESDAELRRFRFKLGGRLFAESLDYYTEYDFPSDRLLDLRVTWTASEALQARVGQWKVPYNRERIDSSGKQQFADRSLANDFFTLDRQRGVALFGRLWAGTHAESWYNVGVFEGTGRDGRGSADEPLVLGRWQWNALGHDLEFSQSDVGYRELPAVAVALAAARVRGPYTAFSSAGGEQLDGFEPGDSDRYRLEQVLVETAAQYDGWSWQHEHHWKTIDDTETANTTRLHGGYAQLGYFPHATLPAIPRPFEIAWRYSRVDPDRDRSSDTQTEKTIAINWFFSDHDNKLTLDHSWLHDEAAAATERDTRRWRAQWDVSF